MDIHARIGEVTERITKRSYETRRLYLDRLAKQALSSPSRAQRACGNLAQAYAACSAPDKDVLLGGRAANLGIITAYNDMLSSHQPLERYPELIRQTARDYGAVAQVAGGVPAMCDGVTQGHSGMELSLFSRDIIALAVAVGLSHDVFDAVLYLGVCDKIVPGLVIAALTFGHLPAVFIPVGPMTTGIANNEKSRIRQLYAEGKIGRKELLESEMAAYHGPGICTFYGTANSNQMLMEIMGLHLPGSSFVNPNTPLREALTKEGVKRALEITRLGNEFTPVGEIIDEKAIVNGLVGLHATGGSTNHTIHLIAMARAAGIKIDWTDFADLSDVVPLLVRAYPNGSADVNRFHSSGGMGFLISTLLDEGLLHKDVKTIVGTGLGRYRFEAHLDDDGKIVRYPPPPESRDETVLRYASKPFQSSGGLRLLRGNLGQSVIKISAVHKKHHIVEDPAIVFNEQDELINAFQRGELERDFVAVVRFQGPRAKGMPELHKLTPTLSVLQDRGFKVALVTDGRMSGASGKVPAAIHVTPEAKEQGPIAKIRNGDIIRIDAETGVLDALLPSDELLAREVIEVNRPDGDGERDASCLINSGISLCLPMKAQVFSSISLC